jgi:hypothetical protein
MGSWLDQELACCEFADKRIGKRFGMWMGQQSKGLGQTLPLSAVTGQETGVLRQVAAVAERLAISDARQVGIMKIEA